MIAEEFERCRDAAIADAAQDHRRVTALLVLDHFAADESVQPRF